MSGTKGKIKHGVANPLELGREVVRTGVSHAAKGAVEDAQQNARTFVEQLLGIDLKNNPADGHAPAETAHQEETPQQQAGHVEVFNSAKHHGAASEKPKAHAEKAPHRQAEAAIDYHREVVKSREKISKGEMREMHQNIEQIKLELQKLVASSQILKLEFAEVTMEKTPTVGQYHVNFFEWMLAVIRTAREKVEDSNAWLGTVKGKGAKKGYWGMFKKHGTTFGLSGERAVATQVG